MERSSRTKARDEANERRTMNFLASLFSGGAGKVVEAVGNVVDSAFTSDEERMALENELRKAEMQYKVDARKLDIKEQEIYLKDTQSARDNQSRVQESEHASWLAKNVHSILSLAVIGLTFFLYYWIILDNHSYNPEMKDIVIYILGALTTISTQVVAYFFGSSQGSKDKQKALNGIASAAK